MSETVRVIRKAISGRATPERTPRGARYVFYSNRPLNIKTDTEGVKQDLEYFKSEGRFAVEGHDADFKSELRIAERKAGIPSEPDPTTEEPEDATSGKTKTKTGGKK